MIEAFKQEVHVQAGPPIQAKPEALLGEELEFLFLLAA
jgi:hypothetical protein